MKKVDITYQSSNTIHFLIDDDLKFSWVKKFKTNYNRFFVVIDENVQQQWGNALIKALKSHQKEVFIFSVKANENSKNIHFYPKLVKFLEKEKCNLSDLVIGVGGGIIIDLVSFTCSTYMRGLPMYLIPTTLIGMIDASTAGKTCLSTDENKNILGTFYYPKVVYNNISLLKTHSWYFHRQGLSESFKYGILCSPKLVDSLIKYEKNRSDTNLKKLVSLGIDARVEIRNIHPQASNLGHTFGHAIEKMSNYKILHGDAITVGSAISFYFSKEMGLMSEKTLHKLMNMIKELKLNVYLDSSYNVDRWIDLMMADKKSTSTHLNLVLLKDIYKPYTEKDWPFYKAKPSTVRSFLKKFMKTYTYLTKNIYRKLKTDSISYD
jgi:3-dehydroquinate synthetase